MKAFTSVVILFLSLSAAAAAGWRSDSDPVPFCTTITCGSAAGWFAKPKQTWVLPPGPYSSEVVPSNACIIAGIKGFIATVCLDTTYPSLRCEGVDRIYIDKNGANYGQIEVIPYCAVA